MTLASSNVTGGNKIKASEYNNLRSDLVSVITDQGKILSTIELDTAVNRYLSVPLNKSYNSGVYNTYYEPIHFPDGSTIKGIRAIGRDSEGTPSTNYLYIYFMKVKLSDGTTTNLEELSFIEPTMAYKVNTSNNNVNDVVDNSEYAYYLYITYSAYDGSIKITAITILYTAVNPLP